MLKSILKVLWALFKPVYKFVSAVIRVLFILAGIWFITILLMLNSDIHSLTASTTKPLTKNENGSFLVLNLHKVVEKPFVLPGYVDLARNLGIYVPSVTTVADVTKAIEKAATDDRIKGVIIDNDEAQFETNAIANAIDKAVVKYKSLTKKPIYGYTGNETIVDALTFQHVDKIYTSTLGSFDSDATSVSAVFLKDFFQRYGLVDYSIRVGKYSLANLWTQDGFTPDNQPSLTALTYGTLNLELKDFNKARGTNITADQLDLNKVTQYAYDTLKSEADYGVSLGLSNKALTPVEFSDWVRTVAGVDPKTKAPKLVSLSAYLSDLTYQQSARPDPNKNKKDYYLTYYYSGFLGKSFTAQSIADSLYAKTITARKTDPHLKGIVLRINSLGGAADQAAVLYQALDRVKAFGVPVVVSVADSLTGSTFVGSLGANAVVADKYAVVGGVDASYSLVDSTNTLRAFYGLNPSYFRSTNLVLANARVPFPFNLFYKSPTVVITTPEFMQYKTLVTQNAYQQQVGLIAKAKGLSYQAADKLSQGLVYTAQDALKANLINGIGDLDTAYQTLDKINLKKDPKFDAQKVSYRTANPSFGGGSSVLSELNYVLNSYVGYETRVQFNLTQSQYDALLYTSYANQHDLISSVCLACDNRTLSRNKAPGAEKGENRFAIFTGTSSWINQNPSGFKFGF